MIAGQTLTIVSDRDVIIKRRLVSVDNDVYYVCRTEEFEAAIRENREPTCIGFRREYVLQTDS